MKWGFIRLGTITVRQQCEDPEFPPYMRVCITGESAVGLPFIDVFFRSTALLDSSNPVSMLYELFSDRKYQRRTSYVHDAANRRLIGIETVHGDITRLDTIDTPVPYYDGSGLYMFARCVSGSDTALVLPTVMDYSIGRTSIRFTDRVERISVDAVPDGVPAYQFLGTTDWEGDAFGGMAGDFEGWVSADASRIVLRASVGIAIGSVTIELESMDRPPPDDHQSGPKESP